MSEYQMKPGKLGEKILNGYQKVEDRFMTTFLDEDGSLKTGGMAEKVTAAYQKVEDAVVGGYQKIEGSVVGGYKNRKRLCRCVFGKGRGCLAGHRQRQPGESRRRGAVKRSKGQRACMCLLPFSCSPEECINNFQTILKRFQNKRALCYPIAASCIQSVMEQL